MLAIVPHCGNNSRIMDIGRTLIIVGVVFIIVGGLLAVGFRGLPGDIVVQKKNTVFIFPIVTSLVLSLLISLAVLILRK